jgi:hypothetical protein
MKIGWAFFALAVIAAAVYALNRGIYVGYTVYLVPEGNPYAPGRAYYRMECRYLYPSGIFRDLAGSGFSRDDAAEGMCRFFHSN